MKTFFTKTIFSSFDLQLLVSLALSIVALNLSMILH